MNNTSMIAWPFPESVQYIDHVLAIIGANSSQSQLKIKFYRYSFIIFMERNSE